MALTAVPVEEYLRTSYHPDMEYVAGQLVERHVGEFRHSFRASPHVPHPVIEIVSPDDTASEMLEKIADYLAAGIPHIWVVDPYKRTLLEADQRGIRRPSGLVVSAEPAGEVDFGRLFDQIEPPTV